ncbi:hypothetical protein ACFS5M_08995 [Lacinutrix iliipiscaria]|uniref:Lipocalin-like domain-containing protein n=1 Tax=Lacinutrix iliipiscaria TaxID=1230532 RepID=A0ABW5WPG0_9FLAO
MKTISRIVITFLTLLAISCSSDSSDDGQSGGPGGQDAHTYSLAFTGGDVDGDTFTGSKPNNEILAVRIDGTIDEPDVILLTIAEEAQANNFNVGFQIKMNGDTPVSFNENGDANDSQMVLTYDDYTLNATSGSMTITGMGEVVYQDVVLPYFELEFTAEMQGVSSSNSFVTQVSGTIIVKRKN